MNTPVSFELDKMLNDKGLPGLKSFYVNQKHYELNPKKYTIADVVMWLHEKRGIWICVSVEPESGVFYFSVDKNKGSFFYDKGGDYPSPTEAYTAAIEYTLKTLIP